MVIPVLILCYQTNTVIALFVPLCGRIGSDKNPDLMIGMIAVLFTILITSFCVRITNILYRRKQVLFCNVSGTFDNPSTKTFIFHWRFSAYVPYVLYNCFYPSRFSLQRKPVFAYTAKVLGNCTLILLYFIV